ncbi:MAG: hypothetical protein J5580_00535, partial [Clostridia bacterium]|nr:hypothetical protein [Clostridia bacterium]
MKTIVGIGTPVGFGGIGIVRLSGAQALSIVQKIFNRPLKPRHATLGTIHGDKFTDNAIVIYFPAPHSFTGEDVVEIQAHGGWHLVNRIMQTTIQLGAVPAEPGEFTRLAVLNNKMTLSQAESTLDLINAESDAELQNAARLVAGELQNLLNQVESDLIAARAQIDAYLDYPEDLDSPEIPMTPIKHAQDTIATLLSTARHGQIIKNGINVWACTRTCSDENEALFDQLSLEHDVWIKNITFDLFDRSSIKEAARTIIKDKQPIDILV